MCKSVSWWQPLPYFMKKTYILNYFYFIHIKLILFLQKHYKMTFLKNILKTVCEVYTAKLVYKKELVLMSRSNEVI